MEVLTYQDKKKVSLKLLGVHAYMTILKYTSLKFVIPEMYDIYTYTYDIYVYISLSGFFLYGFLSKLKKILKIIKDSIFHFAWNRSN